MSKAKHPKPIGFVLSVIALSMMFIVIVALTLDVCTEGDIWEMFKPDDPWIASVEAPTNEVPENFNYENWGNNHAKFEVINDDGYEDTQSFKVTILDYYDGDAKWITSDIDVTPESSYRFSVWFKTDVQPKVVIRFTNSDGEYTYQNLPEVYTYSDSETVWTHYWNDFTIPEGVESATVYMSLDQIGWLITDNYELSELPQT